MKVKHNFLYFIISCILLVPTRIHASERLDFCFNSTLEGKSHDVTAAMFVPLNKEMVALIVSLTNPLGIEFYFHANVFFCLD